MSFRTSGCSALQFGRWALRFSVTSPLGTGRCGVLTFGDNFLIFDDMAIVRSTALWRYPTLVSELGADAAKLLNSVGIDPEVLSDREAFLSLAAVTEAVERAAALTETPDFGRRLASRQGIEILGPLGVAARTAATVEAALAIFHTYLSAHSPAMSVTLRPSEYEGFSFLEIGMEVNRGLPHPQTTELSLGVTLQTLRVLLGANYAPRFVEVPHQPVTPVADYQTYYDCLAHFGTATAGFIIATSDLRRPLPHDKLAHDAMVRYLTVVCPMGEPQLVGAIRGMARQLLPTGAASLEVIAEQVMLHPRTLQRRLALAGNTFEELLDAVRREFAERYLADPRMALSHVARQLGYAEQSVLTRACRRWFGTTPASYRRKICSQSARSVTTHPARPCTTVCSCCSTGR